MNVLPARLASRDPAEVGVGWPSYSRPMSEMALPLRELLEAQRDQIKAIAARHHGIAVAVFGSVARGDEHPGSDLDFLVQLEPGARPFEILSIAVALEEALGVSVDVATPESLRPSIREVVLAEAIWL